MSNLEQWIERVNNAEWSDNQCVVKPYIQVQALARTWLRRLCVLVPEAANHVHVFIYATPDSEIVIEFGGEYRKEPVEFHRHLTITFMRDPESHKANRAECFMAENHGAYTPIYFNDIDNILHGDTIISAFKWLYNYPELAIVRYTTQDEFDAINEEIRERDRHAALIDTSKSQAEMKLDE